MKSFFKFFFESNSFMRGFIMAFDLSGGMGKQFHEEEIRKRYASVHTILKNVHLIRKKTDAENLRSDLEKIGNDIRRAMRLVHEE